MSNNHQDNILRVKSGSGLPCDWLKWTGFWFSGVVTKKSIVGGRIIRPIVLEEVSKLYRCVGDQRLNQKECGWFIVKGFGGLFLHRQFGVLERFVLVKLKDIAIIWNFLTPVSSSDEGIPDTIYYSYSKITCDQVSYLWHVQRQ